MFDKFLNKLSLDNEKSLEKGVMKSRSKRFAPNTKIAYKPDLVPTLQKEHTVLQSLYWETLTAAQNHKYDLTRKLLVQFKDQLVEHLLKENTSLYIYLRHTAQKSSSEEAVRAVKSEMDSIGRKVMRFLEDAISNDGFLEAGFVAKFKKVGQSLNERIEREEEYVYPHYRPH